MGIAMERVNEIINAQKDFAESVLEEGNSALEQLASLSIPYTIYGTIEKEFKGQALEIPSPVGDIANRSEPTGLYSANITSPAMPVVPDLSIDSPPSVDWSSMIQPTKPNVVLPESRINQISLGAIKEYIIPSLEPIIYPSYDMTFPDLVSITQPVLQELNLSDVDPMNAGEFIFDDTLIDAIKTRLQHNIVNGGTGLLSAIETAIWQRDLERNEQQLEDSTDKLIQVWAKKGFTLPDGMLANSLAKIQKEYMNKLLDRSREISVKQAELEQANLFKSMELGISLISQLIRAMLDYDNLALRVKEDAMKFSNDYINTQIAINNNLVEVYKAKVAAYGELMRAEIAKIEIYRAQIQAALGILQLNDQQVKIYSAQIEAEIARYSGEIQGQKLIVEIFSEEIKALLAQVGFEESKIKAYAEQVRVVLAKADVYKTELEAVATEINVEKAKIDANTQVIDQWAKMVDVDIARYNVKMEEYKANIELNKAIAGVSNYVNDAEVRAWEASANLNLQYSKLEEESMRSKYQLQIESQKSVAQISGVMASGAMSALNANAALEYAEEE